MNQYRVNPASVDLNLLEQATNVFTYTTLPGWSPPDVREYLTDARQGRV